MRLRHVTFSQALLAVGLICLTLALVVGWELIFWISIGRLVGAGPSIIGPTTTLAIALALALVVILVATRRLKARADGHPLSIGELVVVVGVLGLLLAALFSFQSVVSMATAEWLKHEGLTEEQSRVEFLYLEQLGSLWNVLPSYLYHFSSGRPFSSPPPYGETIVFQAAAFVVPCAVILAGMRRRATDLRAAGGPVLAPSATQLAMCLCLLGLTAWFATAPVTYYSISVENSFSLYREWSKHWVDLAFFAAGGGGPVLALIFLLALRRRNPEVQAANGLLAALGLVALTAGSAAGLYSLELLVVLAPLLLAGLVWTLWFARPVRNGGHGAVGTGYVLLAAASVGLMVLVTELPLALDAVARWRLVELPSAGTPPYGVLIAMPAVAGATNLALLALAVRYLGAGGGGAEGAP